MDMRDIEGFLIGLKNEGTIIGAQVELAKSKKVQTFWGDHRMMSDAFGGRKYRTRVLIHYQSEWDWTVEFPDEE
jgi:hypothetical protein